MTVQEAELLIKGKGFEFDGNYYDFRNDGTLVVTNREKETTENHEYHFYEKDGYCYIRIRPSISESDLEVSLYIGGLKLL